MGSTSKITQNEHFSFKPDPVLVWTPYMNEYMASSMEWINECPYLNKTMSSCWSVLPEGIWDVLRFSVLFITGR